MTGTQFFTDANHNFIKQAVFDAEPISGANLLKISKKPVCSNFIGFGVAITGASCYNLKMMDKETRHSLLENLYSENGLNLSAARLSVASSDYSAELYSYDDTEFDTELKHFSIERDKEYIIPMIKEILKINPNLYIFASPWSPPGWMKTGGKMCGGFMRREYIDCYAEYIIKYIKAYAEEGITISAITPQNEPETQQSGRMPACIWHPETEADFIKVLKQKLRQNSMDVEIWMYDHSFDGTDSVLWTLKSSENLSNYCDGVAFHYYSGAIEQTLKIKEEFPALKLHFTEGGPRLYDNYGTDRCKWGIMIAKALSHGYSSFTGWNLILDECGGPNIGPFLCGGLVTLNRTSNEISYSGQYTAMRHIAPYINRNSDIYSVTDCSGETMFDYPNTLKKISGFMVDNHDGKKTLILINPNDTKVQTQFDIGGRLWYAELPPDSISTLIID